MQLADTDDLALWYALNRLMTNYWADVDGNSGSQAHEFYLSDAFYAVGANRFEGQQKIRAFYDRRRQRGSTLASPDRQSPGIPGRCAPRPGARGDEPLSGRWSPAD